MFLREMNAVRGLCKKKYSLGTKKPRAFLELEGQRAKIIDPLSMWNEWLVMASSSALEAHSFNLESDFMLHPITGPQTWSAFTSPPGTRHSCCSENSTNSKSQFHFLLFPWTEKHWSPLFWVNPHLWRRLDCNMCFLHWAGDGKGNCSPSTDLNSHFLNPLSGLLVTTQSSPPFSPDLPWVSGLLLSSREHGQTSREASRLSHLPGLSPEYHTRTFSEAM